MFAPFNSEQGHRCQAWSGCNLHENSYFDFAFCISIFSQALISHQFQAKDPISQEAMAWAEFEFRHFGGTQRSLIVIPIPSARTKKGPKQ